MWLDYRCFDSLFHREPPSGYLFDPMLKIKLSLRSFAQGSCVSECIIPEVNLRAHRGFVFNFLGIESQLDSRVYNICVLRCFQKDGAGIQRASDLPP
jgi:hypothetical protein